MARAVDRQRGSRARRSSRIRFVLGFVGFFVVLWLLWNTWLVAPLKWFVVLLHEISHGAVAVATGGTIERIVITADQGGACYCGGGDAFLTLSAGYLGSLTWGAALVLLAQRLGNRSRWITVLIGGLVGLITLLFIRNAFGLLFGAAAAAGLMAAARYLSAAANARLLWTLGLTSCLYALLDIKSDILDRPGMPSDARMLAEMTGIPTVAWGILWILTAVGVCGLLVRALFRRV